MNGETCKWDGEFGFFCFNLTIESCPPGGNTPRIRNITAIPAAQFLQYSELLEKSRFVSRKEGTQSR